MISQIFGSLRKIIECPKSNLVLRNGTLFRVRVGSVNKFELPRLQK